MLEYQLVISEPQMNQLIVIGIFYMVYWLLCHEYKYTSFFFEKEIYSPWEFHNLSMIYFFSFLFFSSFARSFWQRFFLSSLSFLVHWLDVNRTSGAIQVNVLMPVSSTTLLILTRDDRKDNYCSSFFFFLRSDKTLLNLLLDCYLQNTIVSLIRWPCSK